MATVTVCDICGKDASSTRTIDVCSAHETPDGRARPKLKLEKCEVCGKRFTPGAGMSAHMRSHG